MERRAKQNMGVKMKNFKILFVGLLISLSASAERISQDKYVHAGVVYAAQLATYGVASNVGLTKTESLIFSTLLVSMVYTAKEIMDMQRTGKFDTKDMIANGIGQAAALGTVFVFNF